MKGFTLIELLVVIAIIGILTSMIVVSVTSTKASNRDTTRMMNMNEIFKALALYQNNNGRYPVYTGNITGSDAMSLALQNDKDITQIPTDPLSGYTYTYTSINGLTFVLEFCLETNSIKDYLQGCGNTISP